MNILSVEGVDKQFPGVKALDGVSLAIADGEVHGLIGPNGSGKSTLIFAIMGFYSPDAGSIEFLGKSMHGLAPWDRVKRGLSLTHQTPLLVSEKSVYEHIELGVIINKRDYADILAIAELVGLEAELDEEPDQLAALGSKKLEIAKAVSSHPKLLLLDECFAGLSHEEGLEIIEVIQRIRRERGTAVLVTDHNLALVERLADRTTVIDLGVVIAEGRFEEILKNEAVISAYMG